MAETAASTREHVDWRHLIIALAVGSVPTLICFIFGWWWPATLFLLITLLLAAFASPHELYPMVFTIYAAFAIAWVSASLINSRMVPEGDVPTQWEQLLPILAGLLLGLILPFLFWMVVIYVVARWILALSDSLGVSQHEAFNFVAARIFDIHQYYWIIENGKRTVNNDRGLLSKVGGPGLVVVRPGNVAVLERGGRTTRIVGPGAISLKRLEFLKEPVEGKGIIDLRPQAVIGEAENVRTRDGIPLQIKVGMMYQVEPKSRTDEQPGSHFAGGDATTPILGAPEYPVYEAIIRKVVFNTTPIGTLGMFPSGPINVMRDIVATYTLDEIFSLQDPNNPQPEQRTTYRIEQEVNKRFNPSAVGVWFKGIDIREIRIPEDVDKQWIKRWQAPIASQLRVREAEAERDAMLVTSEGRAQSLERIEGARLKARTETVKAILGQVLDELNKVQNEDVLRGVIRIVQYMTTEVARDEEMALRYVEAMQKVIGSEGSKTLIISPPTRGGQMPASLGPGMSRSGMRRLNSPEEQEEERDEQVD